MSLLEVRGLNVQYGGIRAVKGIDLDVGEGEVVCVIGANGAGKTTTLRTLAGILAPSAGTLRYAGQDLASVRAHERVGRGLAMVPEGRGVFPRLSVEENLQMGAFSRKDRTGIAEDLERSYERFPRLRERR